MTEQKAAMIGDRADARAVIATDWLDYRPDHQGHGDDKRDDEIPNKTAVERARRRKQQTQFVLDDGFKSEEGFPKDLQNLIDVDRVQQIGASGEDNKQWSSLSDGQDLLAVE